jgi:hypothetical protein
MAVRSPNSQTEGRKAQMEMQNKEIVETLIKAI